MSRQSPRLRRGSVSTEPVDLRAWNRRRFGQVRRAYSAICRWSTAQTPAVMVTARSRGDAVPGKCDSRTCLRQDTPITAGCRFGPPGPPVPAARDRPDTAVTRQATCPGKGKPADRTSTAAAGGPPFGHPGVAGQDALIARIRVRVLGSRSAGGAVPDFGRIPETGKLTPRGQPAQSAAHCHDHRVAAEPRGTFPAVSSSVKFAKDMADLEPRYGIEP